MSNNNKNQIIENSWSKSKLKVFFITTNLNTKPYILVVAKK